MDLAAGLNANLRGVAGAPVMVFLHGFGCGQEMWRHVAPAFESSHRVLLLDLPGSGAAAPETYDTERHSSLDGYVEDLLQLLDELDLSPVTLVGHSVASMIAVLAQAAAPSLVDKIVMVAPSARYVDDGDYRGGFSPADIDDLVELISRNQQGWQEPVSALVAGGSGEPAQAELEGSFCRTRPEVAAQFADVTFRGDNRADLAAVTVPTLVLQVRHDLIAPLEAGRAIHDSIAGSQLQVLETRGHAPHLSAPADVIAAIQAFVGDPGGR